jgi:hypothetical protein
VSAGALLLIIHQSPLRTIAETEVVRTLTDAENSVPRRVFALDTRQLKDDVDGGHWQSSHLFVHEQAAQILRLADEIGANELRYFGIAEVPHVLALGAYLGDERLVRTCDYDRDRNVWEWPPSETPLAVTTMNHVSEIVEERGDAVLRVEISYPIQDVDIEAAIGKQRLSNIRIVPQGRPSAPGLVRSEEDVATVRSAVREALASLASARPAAETIHLFVAAPVSVCLAIGQELRLRNGKDVQTYRYRAGSGDRALTQAILLTSGDVREPPRKLSAEEVELAQHLRTVWQVALEQVREHARETAPSDKPLCQWYENLEPADALRTGAPFPTLKPMALLIKEADRVAPAPVLEEFNFDKDSRTWHFSDELLLAMFDAAGRDDAALLGYARLFFWHEYVHDWQGLTADTSLEVGRLPNCLERLDYMADVYAMCHQVDFLARNSSETDFQSAFRAQIDIALRSFWAFEPAAPLVVTQERRLRRYLNWYWQRVKIRESPDLKSAIDLLARQPCIEISGLRHRLAGGRILVVLRDPGGFRRLHVGVVLDDGRFRRFGSSTDLGIEELLGAFSQKDHDAISRFFSALAEHVK